MPTFSETRSANTISQSGDGQAWNDSEASLEAAKLEDEDTVFTGLTQTFSKQLRFSDFGFEIPDNATILGVTVRLVRQVHVGQVIDQFIRIWPTGSPGVENKADSEVWPGPLTSKNYGGSADLWGETLTPAIVNGSEFGFAVSFQKSSGLFGASAAVDYGEITVTYDLTPTGDFVKGTWRGHKRKYSWIPDRPDTEQ